MFLYICIVIIEEAAEVLEPHIVASLSEYCEHLILIGKESLFEYLVDFLIYLDF